MLRLFIHTLRFNFGIYQSFWKHFHWFDVEICHGWSWLSFCLKIIKSTLHLEDFLRLEKYSIIAPQFHHFINNCCIVNVLWKMCMLDMKTKDINAVEQATNLKISFKPLDFLIVPIFFISASACDFSDLCPHFLSSDTFFSCLWFRDGILSGGEPLMYFYHLNMAI